MTAFAELPTATSATVEEQSSPALASTCLSSSTALATQNSLAKLDKARQMLAESRTLPEVKRVRDIAEAARVYARAAHLGRQSQNFAAEIALLASRKAGEILSQLAKDKGGRPEKTAASVAAVSEYAQTLKDTNTPERTAQHWQKLAAIPESLVQSYIESARGRGEITATGLLKAKPHAEKRQNRSGPPDSFEVLRKLAVRALNIGFSELKKLTWTRATLRLLKTGHCANLAGKLAHE